MNFTGLLLREIAELRYDIVRDRSKDDEKEGSVLTPSALSTVGLRRAIESRLVRISNHLGVNIQVTSNEAAFKLDSSVIANGATQSLDIGKVREGEATLALRVASTELVGDREPVYNLPVTAASDKLPLFLLRPRGFYDTMTRDAANLFDGYDGKRSGSPETTLTDATHGDSDLRYIAEPVVEWCMENQRLRPSVIDVYSIDKGRDLLSNSAWSPDDVMVDDLASSSTDDGSELSQMLVPSLYHTKNSSKPTNIRNKSNWVKPYLNNDSPEWYESVEAIDRLWEKLLNTHTALLSQD
jgi:hypothetical protein